MAGATSRASSSSVRRSIGGRAITRKSLTPTSAYGARYSTSCSGGSARGPPRRKQRQPLKARAGRVGLDRHEVVEHRSPVQTHLLRGAPQLEVGGEVGVLLASMDTKAQPVG